MIKFERKNRIAEMVNEKGSVSVEYICSQLGISTSTVRRDLTQLDKEGKIKRSRGGAVSIKNTIDTFNYEKTFSQRFELYLDEKKEVALKAFSLIQPNMTIFIDSGTTAFELACLIGDSNINITVVTNSTVLSQVLSINPNVELYCIGGKVKTNTLSTIGSLAVEMIKLFNFDISFVAVNGVSIEKGYTVQSLEESVIKRCMIESGVKSYIITDYTKFSLTNPYNVCNINDVTAIITNDSLDREVVKQIEKQGIEII